ncbi:hypothetical protein LCGC14_3169380 [marine sediment metagenome]|uniref:Glutamine amidotransferase type-2 domain-containing protein n=1 Tax=marine sediment metagenome TaxID=412755 RepID=A0A0F8XLB8_9ZZZZ
MCGICSIVNVSKDHFVDQENLKKMCSAMVHRGPDDEGIKFERNAGLGMRRLSIIDLVTGNQPIVCAVTGRIAFYNLAYEYFNLL